MDEGKGFVASVTLITPPSLLDLHFTAHTHGVSMMRVIYRVGTAANERKLIKRLYKLEGRV